jgi:hypothetical protein
MRRTGHRRVDRAGEAGHSGEKLVHGLRRGNNRGVASMGRAREIAVIGGARRVAVVGGARKVAVVGGTMRIANIGRARRVLGRDIGEAASEDEGRGLVDVGKVVSLIWVNIRSLNRETLTDLGADGLREPGEINATLLAMGEPILLLEVVANRDELAVVST